MGQSGVVSTQGQKYIRMNNLPLSYTSRQKKDLLKEYLTSQIVIWTPTFLFRKECLDVVEGMDAGLKRGQEDRDFYIRMLSHYKLAKVSQPVTNIFMDTKKPLADVSLASRKGCLENTTIY